MISIENIQAINKGALLASCDVHILPWKMTLHEVKIMQKGENRWLVLPSRDVWNQETGERKFIELISFDSDSVKKRFRDQVMSAIDKFLESNPDMRGDDVIKESDEIPF